jgi:hypothetical protein
MGYRNDLSFGDAAAVTPSDTTFVDFHGLYVGGTGDVSIVTGANNTVVLKTVPAGAYLPHLRVIKVNSTGTTATNIVGLKAS